MSGRVRGGDDEVVGGIERSGRDSDVGGGGGRGGLGVVGVEREDGVNSIADRWHTIAFKQQFAHG